MVLKVFQQFLSHEISAQNEYQFEMLNMNEGQNVSITSVHSIQMCAAIAPVYTHTYTGLFNPAVLTSVCLITIYQDSQTTVFKRGAQFMGKLHLTMDFYRYLFLRQVCPGTHCNRLGWSWTHGNPPLTLNVSVSGNIGGC